ncbi:MAG: hypothetical protein IKL07_01690 [Clostridium sp.]|nr:hypothetical protein [Clostridium sp.]
MGEIDSLYLERVLLEAHLKRMCSVDTVDELDRLRGMAQVRLDTLYEMKLESMIVQKAKELNAADYVGETIIIRKDYDYMDQCASSYFRVPKERAEEISDFIDREYSHLSYSGDDMECIIAEELGIEFLKKVWEEDAGPMCSYEPYEKQQAEIEAATATRPRRRGR